MNRKVERSHRIDAEEFYRLLDGVVIDDSHTFDDKLREWEDYNNCHVPHGGLAAKRPMKGSARGPPGSAAKFLGLHVHFDPCSETPEEDDERLKAQIDEFDVRGLLQAELDKDFVDGLGPEWAGLSLTMPLKRVAASTASSTRSAGSAHA